MRFAIVSDTHDNMANFNKAIDFLNKEGIEIMLHCGDISNQTTIDEAEKRFNGNISFVRGNADYYLDDVPDNLSLDIGGKKVAFIHYPDLARKLAETGNYDLVFYGHTHKPWLARIATSARQSSSLGGGRSVVSGEEKECLLVNPGELAGQRFKPTFAIYDTETDKLELKILEKL